MPAGNVSLKVVPVRAAAFVFVRVNVRVETPPTAIGSGEKAFVMVGSTGSEQPVNVTLSRLKSEPAFVFPELNV